MLVVYMIRLVQMHRERYDSQHIRRHVSGSVVPGPQRPTFPDANEKTFIGSSEMHMLTHLCLILLAGPCIHKGEGGQSHLLEQGREARLERR